MRYNYNFVKFIDKLNIKNSVHPKINRYEKAKHIIVVTGIDYPSGP